jgi:hypothetical protein
VFSGGFFYDALRGHFVASGRHCEARERRSNPVLPAAQWIASLALAMTLMEDSTITKIVTSSLG